jgi:NAD(P)-dependent dehydrogenase (short-subunit alcohol dehydrogenase family)
MPTALITGASRGLGRVLAGALAERGWSLVLDARDGGALACAAAELPTEGTLTIAGDVADPAHRADLAKAIRFFGGLDLLCSNASELGPSPLPALAEYPVDALERVYAVNVLAPLAIAQAALPSLVERRGTIVGVSSDAAVEAYAGWGGYGSSKAALDHMGRVLAVEHPEIRVYAFDPGDMRTEMHQRAFPGEDISDRPAPKTVVPALLRLLDERPPSGRYRAVELVATEAVG